MKTLLHRKKLLVVIALVLVAGGAGAFHVLGASGAKVKEPEPPIEVGLGEPFVVNLKEAGHFAKAEIVLKVDAHAELAGAEGGHGEGGGAAALAEQAAARDATIAAIGAYSLSELLSAEGREKLRAELRKRIAEAAHVKVVDVFFVDFAVQ